VRQNLAGSTWLADELSIDARKEIERTRRNGLPDGRWLAFIGEREANAIAPAVVAEKKKGKEGKDEKKEGEGSQAARRFG